VAEKKLTRSQQNHAMLNEFRKRLREKNLDDNINAYTEQHAAQALIGSYTFEGCYKLMDHYFSVSMTPSWVWFKNNADKIYKAIRIKEEDSRVRRILRQQAREWLK
jgi:hypothetical protein